MAVNYFDDLLVSHRIEFPLSVCTLYSTRERSTGRIRLFLFFKENNRLYRRNGLNSTWQPLTDERECHRLREHFEDVEREDVVPRFSTDWLKTSG